ncbi:MAG: hypothetical protein QY330_03850 [Candidatus Dojkabacteria bacterium]|uniref:Uncharacterized protein n=2 Tax=Candidatus Dojkabacteria TaxID=74243 RepID=A0A136KGC6_9BACT|nr:MAG: hypothetical protein UZ20_WS6002000917 [candidate division WS6 bacterium OLB21]MBW7953806.1 hypothetical protein [Candidatus Dojkabacteria bacterium]WKZ27655.1 MAG: hypothetical protein QY330_03850 [Candidatus Dojkabacteria bacterium]
MKNIFRLVLYTLLFFTFVGLMPGIDAKNGPVAVILAGLGFSLIMVFIGAILGFFKFPKNFWGKFLIGSLMSLLYFAFLHFVLVGFIQFGPGYIGGSDFIIFTLPKLVVLADPIAVLIFSAITLVLCSIILGNLSEE